jgi:hypothetical protein
MRPQRWHCPECSARIDWRLRQPLRPWSRLKCFCGSVALYWPLELQIGIGLLAIGIGEAVGIAFALRSTLIF